MKLELFGAGPENKLIPFKNMSIVHQHHRQMRIHALLHTTWVLQMANCAIIAFHQVPIKTANDLTKTPAVDSFHRQPG